MSTLLSFKFIAYACLAGMYGFGWLHGWWWTHSTRSARNATPQQPERVEGSTCDEFAERDDVPGEGESRQSHEHVDGGETDGDGRSGHQQGVGAGGQGGGEAGE